MFSLLLVFQLGVLAGPYVGYAAPAIRDTTWADTLRVETARTWIAGRPSTSDPLVCSFSPDGFFVNGIRMFVKPTVPGGEAMDRVELEAARAYRRGGAAEASGVLAASALVDSATVNEAGEMRIFRADGLSYTRNADDVLHDHGERVGEADLRLAGKMASTLETVARWSPPPTALIITSAGSVMPLKGDAGTIEAQVDYLLSGADPDSLPPGPIWKGSEEVFRDFRSAGRTPEGR